MLTQTLSLPTRSIIIFYKVAVEHDKNDYRDWNIDFDVIFVWFVSSEFTSFWLLAGNRCL